MPLRPGRVGRAGVVGHPVAKTAVVAKAVSPGPVAGRQDRGGRRGGHPGPRRRSPSPHLTGCSGRHPAGLDPSRPVHPMKGTSHARV